MKLKNCRALQRKEQFLLGVFSGALAIDLQNDTHDAQAIAHYAAAIPPDKIPPCPLNAASVFLKYLERGGRPFKWMSPPSLP